MLDLDWLRASGLADALIARAAQPGGPETLGVCGGFQMLGRTIEDPLGIESSRSCVDGLGLIATSTRFGPEKNRHRVIGRTLSGGERLIGYEIHMGETTRDDSVAPWLELLREREGTIVLDGAVDSTGSVYGTYVHGLFDSMAFTSSLVNRLRTRRGLPPLGAAVWDDHRARVADRYAPLSAFLRDHLELQPIWNALGVPPEPGRA